MSSTEAVRSIEFRATAHALAYPLRQVGELRFEARFPSRFDAESFARTAGHYGAASRPVFTRKEWLTEADLRD